MRRFSSVFPLVIPGLMIIRTRKVDLPHDVSRLRNDSVLFPSIPLSTFVNSRLTLRRGASRETRRIEAALRPPFDKLADEGGYDEITCLLSAHPEESQDLVANSMRPRIKHGVTVFFPTPSAGSQMGQVG